MKPWHYSDGDVALIGEFYPPTGPANGRAVLVVHEADGIGGNVRRACARLAALGYVAAAADMHGGGHVLDGDEIPAALARFRAEPALLRRRVSVALDAMVAESAIPFGRTAAMGYCFGGFAALELARSGARLGAVASFHGLLTTACPAEPGSIAARILACTGDSDPLVPPEDVAAFQAEMRSARADWQLLVHGGALHSYTNVDVGSLGDPRMAYDANAAALSWSALLTHLDASLG